MEAIKLTAKQIILQFKTLFGSPIQIALLLFIPFIITSTLPIFFFGVQEQYGVTATLSVSTVTFISYSYFVGEYRKSTLYKNLQTTKSNRWIFNVSSFASIFIISIFCYFFHWTLMFVYSKLNLVQIDILRSVNNDEYMINMLGSLSIWTFYWISLTALISFSIAFGIYRFVSNAKTYYIFIITIILLAVVFEATFNNYFRTYNWDIANNHWADFLQFNGKSRSIFPVQMFIPSLIYPLYAPSQMLNMSGMMTKVLKEQPHNYFFSFLSVWKWQSASDYISLGFKNEAWRWNILYFVPYIQCIAWAGAGTLVSWLKNN